MKKIKISIADCWIAFYVNLLGSLVLAGIWFYLGMRSFTESHSSEITAIKILAWAWTPGSMLAAMSFGPEGIPVIILGMIFSALGFAAIYGLIRGILRKDIDDEI